MSGFGFLRVYSCKQKMTDSHTLLSQYARTGSESAFQELVSRYIDLVYSTAFRLVDGDVESAQDVVQTVFVALASQAGTLPTDVMLGGWLHLRTRFAAGKVMRTERRRQLRERQAAEMNAIDDHSESNLAQVAPVLDEAIGQLDAEDRTAILLRFFERKDFRSVGEALGSSEDAARKRVDRALEKLHALLKQRGATLSAAALGTALAAEAVTAAPAGLAVGISATAVASAAAGTATTLGVLKSMTLAKLTLGITGALVVGVLATFFFRGHQAQLAELSVTGSFTIDVAHAPPNHSHIDGTFSVSCKDRQWIIRSKRSDQTTDYEEDGHDGRYVYSLTSMETWAKNRRLAGQQVGANTMEGEITPGRFPFNSPQINRVLWLLYASSSYLSEMHLIKRLPSIASFSGRHTYLYGFQQPATWRVTGTSPPLPTFAVIYDDGRLRYWEDEDAGFMTGPPLERNWRAPYDKGFTNAVLTVESFSEQGGHRIPRKATFSVYMPKPDGTNAQDLQLSTRYSICLSNVAFHTAVTDFKPEVRGSVLVADRRFERDKQPIYVFSYLAVKHWLSDTEVRQRPEFLRSKQDQAIMVSASRASAQRKAQR
jgi:RNA polymerase sigma factor (sigma-70 family)